MSWKDLLGKQEEKNLLWLGGTTLVSGVRRWELEGSLPLEHGWNRFLCKTNRKASFLAPGEADPDFGTDLPTLSGYLIGDRLIPDSAPFVEQPQNIFSVARRVYLLESNFPRFSRISVWEWQGKFVFRQEEFPLGPESLVQEAFQQRNGLLSGVPGVTPALQLAFRWEYWRRDQRTQQQMRTQETARQANEEAQRRARWLEIEEELFHREQNRRREIRRAPLLPPRQQTPEFPRGPEGQAAKALHQAGATLVDWQLGRSSNHAIVQWIFINHE